MIETYEARNRTIRPPISFLQPDYAWFWDEENHRWSPRVFYEGELKSVNIKPDDCLLADNEYWSWDFALLEWVLSSGVIGSLSTRKRFKWNNKKDLGFAERIVEHVLTHEEKLRSRITRPSQIPNQPGTAWCWDNKEEMWYPEPFSVTQLKHRSCSPSGLFLATNEKWAWDDYHEIWKVIHPNGSGTFTWNRKESSQSDPCPPPISHTLIATIPFGQKASPYFFTEQEPNLSQQTYLFNYAVILDNDEGSEIIVPTTEVMAASEQAVRMIAARQIPDEHADKLDRVRILVTNPYR